MKKTSLLLLCLALAACMQAQTLIPRVGMTVSKIHTELSSGMKSKIGFTLGLAYNHSISEVFSIQPELNFIQKGYRIDYRFEEDGISIDSKGRMTINYVEIPILVKASLEEKNLKIFFNAGPSLGIGLGGKYKTDMTIDFLGDEETVTREGKVKFGDGDDGNEDDAYIDNRMDFGLQFGAGVLIANKITIELRYGHSLSSLTDETDEVSKMKNRVFQFTVGYPIGMK